MTLYFLSQIQVYKFNSTTSAFEKSCFNSTTAACGKSCFNSPTSACGKSCFNSTTPACGKSCFNSITSACCKSFSPNFFMIIIAKLHKVSRWGELDRNGFLYLPSHMRNRYCFRSNWIGDRCRKKLKPKLLRKRDNIMPHIELVVFLQLMIKILFNHRWIFVQELIFFSIHSWIFHFFIFSIPWIFTFNRNTNTYRCLDAKHFFKLTRLIVNVSLLHSHFCSFQLIFLPIFPVVIVWKVSVFGIFLIRIPVFGLNTD